MIGLNEGQRAWQAAARAVAIEIAPLAAEVDRTEAYPAAQVGHLVEAGLMGMSVPEAFGGRGASLLDVVLVVEEIAKVCGTTARIVVEGNLGALGAIMRYGTEAQKQLAADLVLRGDKPAICITEPDAGSAATDMTTRAVRSGGRWILNGKKHWITGAGQSELHLIFARVIENGEDRGIGAFMALKGDPGLRVGRREPTMGLRGLPECEVLFEDLVVSDEMAVIPDGDPAHGFGRLMSAYNAQRVGAATVAYGIAKGAFELATDFVKTREQFGRPLAEFQGLQWMLADMSIALAAAEALIHRAAIQAGTGFPDRRLAAEAKILAAETAVRVTNDALQLHGAAGYSRALPLERMVRDARMFTIGGGTAQILRNQVAGALLDRPMPQTRAGEARDPGRPALRVA